DIAPRSSGRREDPDRRRLGVLSPTDANALTRPEGAAEQPDIGNALAGRVALDLEGPAGDRSLGVPTRPVEEHADAGQELVDPDPERGGAEERRMDEAAAGLRGERFLEPSIRRRRFVADVGPEDGLVVLREELREPGPMGGVIGTERHDGGRSTADVPDRLHRDDRRREPAPDRLDD